MISILSDVEKKSLDVLKGASLSGELQGPVGLHIVAQDVKESKVIDGHQVEYIVHDGSQKCTRSSAGPGRFSHNALHPSKVCQNAKS